MITVTDPGDREGLIWAVSMPSTTWSCQTLRFWTSHAYHQQAAALLEAEPPNRSIRVLPQCD